MPKKKIKLLIVDDEKDICGFVKRLFKKKGFLVYGALSGSQAVKITQKVKPDIALLDIYLRKGIDGLTALKEIRKIAPLCQCVMVTWDKTEARVKEAKAIGAVSYLTKPLTIDQLLRVVSRVAKNIRKRG